MYSGGVGGGVVMAASLEYRKLHKTQPKLGGHQIQTVRENKGDFPQRFPVVHTGPRLLEVVRGHRTLGSSRNSLKARISV